MNRMNIKINKGIKLLRNKKISLLRPTNLTFIPTNDDPANDVNLSDNDDDEHDDTIDDDEHNDVHNDTIDDDDVIIYSASDNDCNDNIIINSTHASIDNNKQGVEKILKRTKVPRDTDRKSVV